MMNLLEIIDINLSNCSAKVSLIIRNTGLIMKLYAPLRKHLLIKKDIQLIQEISRNSLEKLE